MLVLAPQIQGSTFIFQWQLQVPIELVLQSLSLSVYNALPKFIVIVFVIIPSTLRWYMDRGCTICLVAELHVRIMCLKPFSRGIGVLLLLIDDILDK